MVKFIDEATLTLGNVKVINVSGLVLAVSLQGGSNESILRTVLPYPRWENQRGIVLGDIVYRFDSRQANWAIVNPELATKLRRDRRVLKVVTWDSESNPIYIDGTMCHRLRTMGLRIRRPDKSQDELLDWLAEREKFLNMLRT